jgi:3,5-epimerase/4-reductase
MAERVMIFGARGYLGQLFAERYPGAVCPAVDISDRAAVAAALDSHSPTVILNCAGKTGRPNVDWCETHQAETLRANVTGVLVLLEECLNRQAYLVHLGSGCIYSGNQGGRGFREDDPPNFMGSFYSRTKAWSDQILSRFSVLNLRLRMPFDGTLGERNLLTKLRRYPRVLTAANSLTYLPDLLDTAQALIARRATGTFNVVNPGAISPYEVMNMYREIVDPMHSFEPLDEANLGEVAQTGRSNCLLNTDKLAAAGIHLPPVRERLQTALRAIAALIGPTAPPGPSPGERPGSCSAVA